MMNMVHSVMNGTLHNLSLIPGVGYLGAIILFTLLLKIIFLPLKYISMANKIKKELIRDKLEETEKKLKKARGTEKKKYKLILLELYKENKIILLRKRFIFICFQTFLIIQFIYALYNITELEGVTTLWFNLTKIDNTYILSILLLIINLVDGYPKELNKANFITYIVINILVVTLSFYVISSIVVYWIVGAIVSLMFRLLFEKYYYTNQKKILRQT